jgi:hypothetical protein
MLARKNERFAAEERPWVCQFGNGGKNCGAVVLFGGVYVTKILFVTVDALEIAGNTYR